MIFEIALEILKKNAGNPGMISTHRKDLNGDRVQCGKAIVKTHADMVFEIALSSGRANLPPPTAR